MLAGIHVPEFIRLERRELEVLLNILRDPLAAQVYLLLLMQADFAEGHFLGTYARLMDLCTPPQPERGKRRPGPSMWQLRRVVDDLIRQGVVWRKAEQNEAQGQLRLDIMPRKAKPRRTK